ncbi:MAG TPA: hypothetical protein PLG10_03540, partial [Candidatus Dojkabacteria bacterium]|nr:hypothetical protein [Candidatus Dojkabacteria bacterium]
MGKESIKKEENIKTPSSAEIRNLQLQHLKATKLFRHQTEAAVEINNSLQDKIKTQSLENKIMQSNIEKILTEPS